jgi:hypothetical protein
MERIGEMGRRGRKVMEVREWLERCLERNGKPVGEWEEGYTQAMEEVLRKVKEIENGQDNITVP